MSALRCCGCRFSDVAIRNVDLPTVVGREDVRFSQRRKVHIVIFHDKSVSHENLQETMQLALKPASSNVFFEWWEAYQPKLQKLESKTPFVPNNVAIVCPEGFISERYGKMIYSPTIDLYGNDFRSQIIMPHNCGSNLPDVTISRLMSGRINDPRAFWAALFALFFGNYRFFEVPILPISGCSLENQLKYSDFVDQLKKNDIIASRNPKKFVSNLIANLDNGYWSHVAMYLGDGKVIESSPFSGVHEFRIEEYYGREGIHSVYRPLDTKGKRLEGDWTPPCLGKSYNYWGAFRLGLNLFGARLQNSIRRKRTLAGAGRMSPNGGVIDGSFFRAQSLIID